MTVSSEREAFTASEARSYWDDRHTAADELASGGNISHSHASNSMFYAVRTARLIEALTPWTASLAPLTVLDAGCGKGVFSRAMGSFGHRVDGIDTSPVAIAECVRGAGPLESYAVSDLVSWSSTHLYDAVVSIDVLYHLMDDLEWEASVRHLCSLTGVGGRVLLVDHDRDDDRVWSHYQKTRSAQRYRDLLADCGFAYDRYVRNDFRDDPSGFHIATRMS